MCVVGPRVVLQPPRNLVSRNTKTTPFDHRLPNAATRCRAHTHSQNPRLSPPHDAYSPAGRPFVCRFPAAAAAAAVARSVRRRTVGHTCGVPGTGYMYTRVLLCLYTYTQWTGNTLRGPAAVIISLSTRFRFGRAFVRCSNVVAVRVLKT